MAKTEIHIHDIGAELRRYERVLGRGYANDLAAAVRVVEDSRRLAVTTARAAAEHLLKSVLRAREVPLEDGWTLDRLKQEAKKKAGLPRSVVTQIDLIQNLGNEAAHDNGDAIAPYQARQALEALLQVARWVDAQLAELPVPVVVEVEPRPAHVEVEIEPALRPSAPKRDASAGKRSRGLLARVVPVLLGAGLALGGLGVLTVAVVWMAYGPDVPGQRPAPAPAPAPPVAAAVPEPVPPAPAADLLGTVPDAGEPEESAEPEPTGGDVEQAFELVEGNIPIWARPIAPDEEENPPADAVMSACRSGGRMLSVGEVAFGWGHGLAECGTDLVDGWARLDDVPRMLRPPPPRRRDAERQASVARARGDALAVQGQWQDAIAAYTEAIELLPRDASVYALRARARFEDGLFTRARGDIALALTGEPKNALALYERAVFERARGDVAWSSTLDAALSMDPELGGRADADRRLQGTVSVPVERVVDFHPNAATRVDTGLFRDSVNWKKAEERLEGRGGEGEILAPLSRGTPVELLGTRPRWMRVGVEVDDRVVEGWVLKSHLDVR